MAGSAHHEFQEPDDGIHTPFFARYANEADRLSDTRASGPRTIPGDDTSPFRALIPSDVNKIAIQLDDQSLWILLSTTPTWGQLFVGTSPESTKVDVAVRKASSGTLNIGDAVYVHGYDVPNTVITAELAQASSVLTSPALGIVSTPATDTTTGKVRVIGQLAGLDTSSFVAQDELFVSESVAGALTTTRPTGANAAIQKVAVVAFADPTNGVVNVKGGIRANSLPNLTAGKAWIGDGSNLPVEVDFPVTTATAPVNVTKSAASVGTSPELARQDHKHDVSTAAAVNTGTVSAEGAASTLARSDHTHKVTGIQSVAISATAAVAGQILRTSDAVNASWVTPIQHQIWMPADTFILPTSGGWFVPTPASIVADSAIPEFSVARFDDSGTEGIAFELMVPENATTMALTYIGRAQTAPGGAQIVKVQLYSRQVPNNSAPAIWTIHGNLTDVSIPTNTNYQYTTDSRTLASWTITAGRPTLFEFVRNGSSGSDTLVGDYNLKGILVRFS